MPEKSYRISPRALHILFTLFPFSGVMAFAFSLPMIFIGFHSYVLNYSIGGVLMLGGGALGGFLAAHRARLPSTFAERYAPAAAPLFLALLLCAAGYVLGGGSANSLFLFPYGISQIAFAPILIYTAFTGNSMFMLFFPLTFHCAFLASFALREQRRSDRTVPSKRMLTTALCVLLALLAVLGTTELIKRRHTLPPSYGMAFGGGFSSVDLWAYDVTAPDNRLPRLSGPSDFTIQNHADMPVLDGAEAAYPVYSAFALACYENIASLEYEARNQKDIAIDQSGGRAVTFTNTIYAYERLLSGDVDIFFGAQPSAAQLKMAEDAGKKLVLTPIGLEAFVFFTSEVNPVDGLTTDEIRSIYSGKQRNWSVFGGKNERIYAFQRPENSGSQTIMQRLMGNVPLAKPLKEEYVAGMGGVVNRVAEYRDGDGSLGYSFRFFLTGMAEPAAVKLLAVDGVAPTPENIASRTYPHTVELYAVTLADNPKPAVAPFLAWMQSAQGQELVERTGYIALSK